MENRLHAEGDDSKATVGSTESKCLSGTPTIYEQLNAAHGLIALLMWLVDTNAIKEAERAHKDYIDKYINRPHLKAQPTPFDPNRHCDAERVIKWIDDDNRPRAYTAFTEGLERQIAYRFENAKAQPDVREALENALEIIDERLRDPNRHMYYEEYKTIQNGLKAALA